jgi:hypothetical protein
MQIDDVTHITVDQLISKENQFNGFVVPQIADDVDEFNSSPSSVGLKRKFLFVVHVFIHFCNSKKVSVVF